MSAQPQPRDIDGDKPALRLVTAIPDPDTPEPFPWGDTDEDSLAPDPVPVIEPTPVTWTPATTEHVSEVIRTPAPVTQVAATPVVREFIKPVPRHQQKVRPLTYWATGITVAGHLLLGAAAWLADPEFVIIALCVICWTICGLLTICAEMLPRAMENQDIEHARQAQAMADAR